jgi:transcriptional regulator with XRE-family HTH domain
MARQPRSHAAPPEITDDPLPEALACTMRRRGLSVAALGSLLRAEGVGMSKTRLHQLCSGAGAPPTAEQIERLASVLGVAPDYFAEYRLWRLRAMLDPSVVGFDRAMANLDRVRGRLWGGEAERDGIALPGRYPGSSRTMWEERA